jgi:chemotaxis signal transduction protein
MTPETPGAPPLRALRAGLELPILPTVSSQSYLLVRAGEDFCALPLLRVRRIVRELAVSPLPGTAPELKGLAEFGGEPLPVLDLGRLVGAAPGATPPFAVTVLAWAGPEEARELVGLAVDSVVEVVEVPAEDVVAGGEGIVRGEASVGDRAVRVLALSALGGSPAGAAGRGA